MPFGPMTELGSADAPNISQDAHQNTPTVASAVLRRRPRRYRRTNSWATTMTSVSTVSDDATTRTGSLATRLA